MNVILRELFTVIEDELAVGRELLQNLERRKTAIVEWDLVGLMEQLEEKERWLRALDALEQQRSSLLMQMAGPNAEPPTLRELATGIAQVDEADLWRSLRERARETLTRLTVGERDLAGLMENISLHIQEALRPLNLPSLPLYGGTGAAASQRPSAGLIHGKV